MPECFAILRSLLIVLVMCSVDPREGVLKVLDGREEINAASLHSPGFSSCTEYCLTIAAMCFRISVGVESSEMVLD